MTSSWLRSPRRRTPVGHRAVPAAVALSLASVMVVSAAGAATPASAPVASTGTEAVVTGVLASFYRPPSPLPYAPAGTIIRSEVLSPDPGLPTGTRAWRVLYHSTSDSGGDLAESGVVVVPGGTPPAGGYPIVSWAHGTTGVASGCAPSVTGTSTIPDLAARIRSRQIVVASDYRGLGAPGRHPDLVGTSEAQDVLDAARAARSLLGGTASNAVAVLGFSQGGQAALFAGEVAPTYAPELFLAAVAAVAPVTSVLDLAPTGDLPPPSGQSAFTAMVLYAWARHYGTFQLGSVLTPAGIADLSAVSSSCVNTIASLYDAVAPGQFFLPGWQARPAGQAANQANRPGNAPTSAPILIVQGSADTVVPFTQTTRFVARQLCRNQYDTVDYVAERGVGHGEALDQSTALIDRWLQGRFNGTSGTDSCTRPGLGVPTSH
jgi:pimeloyl-ACP methyl ester carboxylesterase